MTAAERQQLADLAASAGGDLRFEVPLAELTTWKIGGPAEAVYWPRTRAGLVAAAALARRSGWPLRVMGNGSNLLCPDQGVRGLVLNLTNSLAEVRIDGTAVVAEAGAFLPKLARETGGRGLLGLEGVVGVPGTVGGGCVMNAGVPSGVVGDVLSWVEVLTEQGEERRLGRDELALGHRESRLQHEPWLVLAARFELTPGDAEAALARMAEHMAYRKRTQPLSEATCGSVFRRPPDDYPGRLIEVAGGKGLRRGGAVVCELHANWIVNEGGASAADVRALMADLRERVRRQCGVELVPEVVVWEP